MLKLPQKANSPFRGRTVKLIDGSMLTQGGTRDKKGGKSIRLHMCYNLTAGAMDSVLLTDHHTAESPKLCNINAGDIIMGDAGFGKGKNIAHVTSQDADALFRATPSNMRLSVDKNGKQKIDMFAKLKNTKGDIVDFNCYIHTENGHYHPIRVVASRLPEDKAVLAKKRKKRTATRKQFTLGEQSLVYAEWVILITTLDDSYSAEELLIMYRARWQVELLFKRIKQTFKVQKLPPATLRHSTVMVLLWLILWAVVEKQSLSMEVHLIEKGVDMSRYSPWAAQSFVVFQISALIHQVWIDCTTNNNNFSDAFIRLLNHRSCRENQYFSFHLDAYC